MQKCFQNGDIVDSSSSQNINNNNIDDKNGLKLFTLFYLS